MATEQQTKIDPVTFSILSSSFVALVDEIASSVQRSCLSFSSAALLDTLNYEANS